MSHWVGLSSQASNGPLATVSLPCLTVLCRVSHVRMPHAAGGILKSRDGTGFHAVRCQICVADGGRQQPLRGVHQATGAVAGGCALAPCSLFHATVPAATMVVLYARTRVARRTSLVPEATLQLGGDRSANNSARRGHVAVLGYLEWVAWAPASCRHCKNLPGSPETHG